MDQRHRNDDPLGVHADATAARRRLTELDRHTERQRQLPDLRAQRDAVLKAKREVAEQIAAVGPEGQHAQTPERQRLTDRLTALNLALDDLDHRIAAITAPIATATASPMPRTCIVGCAPDDGLPERPEHEVSRPVAIDPAALVRLKRRG
jgi:hypothetical protein